MLKRAKWNKMAINRRNERGTGPFFVAKCLYCGGKWCIVDLDKIVQVAVSLILEGKTMFLGEYENSIDAKNRIIIPSKFRKELGVTCYLSKGPDNCLTIYPEAQWQEHIEKLRSLPTNKAGARNNLRKYTSNSGEAEVDGQGRITIPQKFFRLIGFGRDVVGVGCIDKIEVWDRGEWEKVSGVPDDEEYEV